MAKKKMSKKSGAIDMTAMCDVSFLLLTFFILTATARQPSVYPVDMPASTVQTKLPDLNLGIITVGDNQVYFGVKEQPVRRRMLERMGEKYSVQFTETEKERFSVMEEFGVPINQLKSLISLDHKERKAEGLQKGIPHDSTDNQLKEWLYAARYATKEVNNEELKIAIKGDAAEDYPNIKRVIDILQDQQLNKFFLVTNLRTDDF